MEGSVLIFAPNTSVGLQAPSAFAAGSCFSYGGVKRVRFEGFKGGIAPLSQLGSPSSPKRGDDIRHPSSGFFKSIIPAARLATRGRGAFIAPMRPHPGIRFALPVLLFLAPLARAHEPAEEMRDAANALLATLNDEQKTKAIFPLNDAERENWNFVPLARSGLPFKQMTPAQHDLALALLRTGLSQRGFARAEAIISMENVLKELENGAARRDPTLYYVTIFGAPSADKSWGWRFEGHHLSFNFTVVNGTRIFFAPSFIGSNPGEVRSGPRKGERVLGEEDDLGRAFVKSLDEAQRKIAVISEKAPGEIITSNSKRADPLAPAGIAYAQLTPPQREQLLALVKLYINRWRPEIADETYRKLEAAGLEKIAFAWAGGFERGDGNYYRIQTPTFLIEFDNTQGNANHIHTVFRDFKGDFGHDLLREHYEQDHKK
jgi:hypothetical protein